MTTEQATQLLILRGHIAGLTEDQQHQIKQTADLLRDIVARDKDFGAIALALVGAELSVQP